MRHKVALSSDFKEFIESLNASGVKYLVVGGYAVAFHGRPRYTKDLDIWVQREPENAARIVRAIDDFGFSSLGLKEADFLELNQVVQFGYPPLRIDLMTDVAGVEFDACYSSRVEVEVDGTTVAFIDVESLKQNKRAAGRLQDLADAEHLE